jgi:hypothetical protein
MALKRLVIDGFGQVELNNVAFRRDGRIEAQAPLDSTDFANAPAENGMLLEVDPIKRTLNLPGDGNAIVLVYSAEHIYDERTPGLKNYANFVDSFYPRAGYLSVGDKYTTNCIAYDDTEFADETALKAAVEAVGTTPLYAVPCANGAHKLTKTAPQSGAYLVVRNAFTMPNGKYGVQLYCVRA